MSPFYAYDSTAISQLEKISSDYNQQAEVRRTLVQTYSELGQQEYRDRQWKDAIQSWSRSLEIIQTSPPRQSKNLPRSLEGVLRRQVRKAKRRGWFEEYKEEIAFVSAVFAVLACVFAVWPPRPGSGSGSATNTSAPTASSVMPTLSPATPPTTTFTPTPTETHTSTPATSPAPPIPEVSSTPCDVSDLSPRDGAPFFDGNQVLFSWTGAAPESGSYYEVRVDGQTTGRAWFKNQRYETTWLAEGLEIHTWQIFLMASDESTVLCVGPKWYLTVTVAEQSADDDPIPTENTPTPTSPGQGHGPGSN